MCTVFRKGMNDAAGAQTSVYPLPRQPICGDGQTCGRSGATRQHAPTTEKNDIVRAPFMVVLPARTPVEGAVRRNAVSHSPLNSATM